MKPNRRLVAATLAWLLTAALASFGSGLESERIRRGDERLDSNWHLGPFFEYRRTSPGDSTFWAVRPFYSQVRSPSKRTSAYDVLWPVFSLRDHADADWWNALVLCYGDSRDTDPSWSFNFVPLAFCGSDRDDRGYWGLFPIYGHHPHPLLMDDWTFALWPIWHTYTVKGVRSHAVLWPFVTWRDEPRAGVGVWPFYGQSRQRESEHRYVLWPLVTWAAYDEDRDTSGAGSSWWLLPFYGEVRRTREWQSMVLPPFFSYTETGANGQVTARRWRLPWPLVDFERTPTRDRVSVWPFWEQLRGYSYIGKSREEKTEERTWRVGWKLIENTELSTSRSLERRFNLFPFFTWERRWTKPRQGEPQLQDSYFRIWPFWSSETVGNRNRSRTLELMPMRHNEGIERNWAPFWSLWERDDRPDGRTRYSLLWNFIAWQSGD